MIKACLIGRKLGHSLSPVIHNKIYELAGIKGSYELCETPEESLEEVIEELKSNGYAGANVTIPYKTTVMKYLDEISEEAKAIGAVNTISFINGRTKGYNTDYFGLKMLLDSTGIKISGGEVVVLGSGGASKCAVKLAHDMSARNVVTVSRSKKENSVSYEELEGFCAIDVLINTTPAGMYPDVLGCPVSDDVIEKSKNVVDVVYNPQATQLVRKAVSKGKNAVGGLLMLTAQAVKAQEIWSGRNIEEKIYQNVYEYVRDLKTNIVLIGMPGSGKSAIGRAAAKKLSKNFVDTDELIERRYGRIPDIFNKQGETVFREYERQAVSLAADIRGTVTATGGGVILDKRNIDELKKTGLVVFIDRPLSDLIEKTDGSYRPLIAGDNSRIKTLYEQRYPLYKKHADAVVINDEDIEKCVNEITRIWGSMT